jgi:molybdopterin-guanine dinucleotide biosynthesis protein MobB
MANLPFTPTISFVGHSNSGKTTLIEKIIPELSSRNYRISIAKHVGDNVIFDTPGKDTWRFSRAGAHSVIVSMNNNTVVMKSRFQENTIDQLQYAAGPDCDLLLVEGHKRERGPKIEVRRSPESKPVAVVPDLVAIVSASAWPEMVPCFDPSDLTGIANFIEQLLLKQRRSQLAMYLNGHLVQPDRSNADKLVQAAESLIAQTEGTPGSGQLELWLRLKNRG